MPDFDIDFCQDRRDEVIRYVQERYGRDQVAQIITFGTLQARGVLRDVGRVLEMPYGQVDKLCKLVPQNPRQPVTLARAIEGEPRLQAERDREPIVERAFDIAQKLEVFTATLRPMPPALSSATAPLTEMVPLYRDPKSDMPVTQFNMKWVEQAGLVKFDFLGLKTLTVLETAVALAAPARHRDRPRGDSARRRQNLCDAGACRCGRHLPTGKSGHAARAARHAAGPLRGHHRAGRALSAGSNGEHPDLLFAQARRGAGGLHPSQARADAARDLRRHRLPGTGNAGCADLAGYSLGEADLLRRAMGKKIRQRNAEAAQPLHIGLPRARDRRGRRPIRFSSCSSVSPITASTRATPPLMRSSRIRRPI